MTNEGVKHDNGKAPMSLIAYDVIEKVAHVLGFGAKKYAPNNWKKGMKMSRVMDATLRHLTAWNEGEDIDPESGLNHIDHALCELMFLRWYTIHKPELDDRYKSTYGRSPSETTKECIEDLKNINAYFDCIKKSMDTPNRAWFSLIPETPAVSKNKENIEW